MSNQSKYFKLRFQNFASLDIRSLGVFRISLGLLSICYFSQALANWSVFFSHTGVLSSPLALFQDWMYWSLFNWIPESIHAATLWIAVGFAILYTLGIFHRLSSFIILFTMISIHHRNYLTVQNGYVLLYCLLFWSAFLPLGKIWSLSKRSSFSNTNYRIHSWPVLLLITQISFVYLFSFIHKSNASWLWEGNGVLQALSYSPHVRPLGEKLLQLSWILPFLTWGTQLTRLSGALALWIPYYTEKIRGTCVIIFIIMHSCFAATLTLGTFSYVCIAMWTALIPSSWWNKKKRSIIVSSSENFGFKVYGSIVLLLILIFTNIHSIPRENFHHRFWPHALGIAQRWAMFANIGEEHRWLRILKEDSKGVFTFSPLFPELLNKKPVSSLYPNEMSRRYHEILLNRETPQLISEYASYVCKKLERNGEKTPAVVLQIMATTVDKFQTAPYSYSVKRSWRTVCL